MVLSLRSNSRAIRKVKSFASARKTEANNCEKRMASSKSGWKTATMALTRNQRNRRKAFDLLRSGGEGDAPSSAKVRE